MRHQNTVFHQISKFIPWRSFDGLVDEHKSDFRCRTLSSKTHLMSLLYAQLSGSDSLREISLGLSSHAHCLYHAGTRPVARSTLSDANQNRSWKLFRDLFLHMSSMAARKTRREFKQAIRILDASPIELNGLSQGWARFSNNNISAKLHVVYDPENSLPLQADVTPSRINDICVAKTLKLEPNCHYVFDLGYYSFQWWTDIDAAGSHFVSRLKRNTRLEDITDKVIEPGQDIVLSDKVGYLPKRMSRGRKNPMIKPVREIMARNSQGTVLRLLTNNLEASATQIADLYKARWQVELFFRWIKQTLKVRHFIGTSENAIRIQIYVALITYLLLQMAQRASAVVKEPLAFVRLIRINLMHKRLITDIHKPNEPPPKHPNQMKLNLNPC